MFTRQALLATALAASASAHATWQQLWINNVDFGGSCVRHVATNNPVQAVTSADMACNIAAASAPNTCAVKAGDTLSVEMHQQAGDRSCASEAIGGQHYGPIMIYLAKVSNAATAVGASSNWFKISEGGLMSKCVFAIQNGYFLLTCFVKQPRLFREPGPERQLWPLDVQAPVRHCAWRLPSPCGDDCAAHCVEFRPGPVRIHSQPLLNILTRTTGSTCPATSSRSPARALRRLRP